jgi:hypothetical protein
MKLDSFNTNAMNPLLDFEVEKWFCLKHNQNVEEFISRSREVTLMKVLLEISITRDSFILLSISQVDLINLRLQVNLLS